MSDHCAAHQQPMETQNMAQAPEAKHTLLRLQQVQEIVPYSSSSIYHMVAKGDFPAPVKLGPRASAWLASEIHSWVESRIHLRKALEA